jgi:uncharacterized membrane protein (DUF485 family)
MDSAQRDRLLGSRAFARLVTQRWRVSLTLTLLLFVMYYGYIVLIAVNKPFMARRLGGVTPIGVPLGVAVILGSWVLTAVYIVWANRSYDPEVARLRDELERR